MGAVGAAILYLRDPTGNAFFPKCMVYSATGLYCPGCGTQRALHHLLHARIARLVFAVDESHVPKRPGLAHGFRELHEVVLAGVGAEAVQDRHLGVPFALDTEDPNARALLDQSAS